MTIADVTRSLDDVCVIEDPERPSSPESMMRLLAILDDEIRLAHEDKPESYLSQPADFMSMTVFSGKERNFQHLKLVSTMPFDIQEWGYDDLADALQFMKGIVSRVIERSDLDLRRSELFRAEAARRAAGSTTTRHVLLSSLPWTSRRSESRALQNLQQSDGSRESGLLSLSTRQACIVSYERRSRQNRNPALDEHANLIIRIDPMKAVIDRKEIDPIDLMALIALDEEGE